MSAPGRKRSFAEKRQRADHAQEAILERGEVFSFISCHWCDGGPPAPARKPPGIVRSLQHVFSKKPLPEVAQRVVYGLAEMTLECSWCDDTIAETSPIIAVTKWRKGEPEPEIWEGIYLREVAKERWTHIADRLSKIRERLRELTFGKIHS